MLVIIKNAEFFFQFLLKTSLKSALVSLVITLGVNIKEKYPSFFDISHVCGTFNQDVVDRIVFI